MPVAIEIASADDAEAILALQRRAYRSEAEFYGDWSFPPLTETVAEVRASIARATVLKGAERGAIVGSVRGEARDGVCCVGRLIVEPARQRRGIGSALLEAIEARFPDAGAFALFTGARSVDSIRLYRRHGYEPVETEVVSEKITLLHMRKSRRQTRGIMEKPHVDR